MIIKELNKKDIKKIIDYTIKGMHFGAYLDNKILLNIYGKYYWYKQANSATEILSAYQDDVFLGILIANFPSQKKIESPLSNRIFVSIVEFFLKHFFKDSSMLYEKINRQLYEEYSKKYKSDGEITLLLANPEVVKSGIGTFLLSELCKRHPKQRVHIFTDDYCSYQFYEKRGFDKVGEIQAVLKTDDKQAPIRCMLFSKVLD